MQQLVWALTQRGLEGEVGGNVFGLRSLQDWVRGNGLALRSIGHGCSRGRSCFKTREHRQCCPALRRTDAAGGERRAAAGTGFGYCFAGLTA
ncbi:hypothetical protein chiPu_0012007 [Chiloscyllium punctatum]|uniref:Uncharacterized protein n=1 Tax=Chiloscyllium punctatum TaxID=137246 RepID=A0A401ST02_CHIPU|nr:hypothetical protein [Chiloscyllium punctatum]